MPHFFTLARRPASVVGLRLSSKSAAQGPLRPRLYPRPSAGRTTDRPSASVEHLHVERAVGQQRRRRASSRPEPAGGAARCCRRCGACVGRESTRGAMPGQGRPALPASAFHHARAFETRRGAAAGGRRMWPPSVNHEAVRPTPGSGPRPRRGARPRTAHTGTPPRRGPGIRTVRRRASSSRLGRSRVAVPFGDGLEDGQ